MLQRINENDLLRAAGVTPLQADRILTSLAELPPFSAGWLDAKLVLLHRRVARYGLVSCNAGCGMRILNDGMHWCRDHRKRKEHHAQRTPPEAG